MKMPRKLLASILTLSLIISNFPVTAYAAEQNVSSEEVIEETEEAEITEVETAEVETAEVETAEVEATEVETAEVEATEVETAESDISTLSTETSLISGTCGENVTWTYDSTTYELVLSGNGAMKAYTASSLVPWYSYNASIKNVIIGEGITTISPYAFKYCSSLTSIKIADTVTSIGDEAFSGCTALEAIEFPSELTSIGYRAFYNCYRITSIVIPNKVTTIGEEAFDSAIALETVEFQGGLSSIGQSAFQSCDNLKSVEFSDTVTDLGTRLFSNCTELEKVVLPKETTAISQQMFFGCSSLTTLENIDEVTTISSNAFSGCTSLTDVSGFTAVTTLENGVFAGCTGLTSILDNDVLNTIGESVYSGCTGLTSIELNGAIETIGSSAFSGCTGVKELIISKEDITLGYNVFSGIGTANKNLSIIISDDLTTLPANLFNGMEYLGEIDLGSKLTDLGNAFRGCTALTKIEIPDTVTTGCSFEGCTALESVKWSKEATVIPDSAFRGCSSLTTITNIEQVEEIGSLAFSLCTSLTSFEIPVSVTSIGTGVFSNSTALETVVWNKNLSSIPEYTFNNCTALKKVTNIDSITSIGNDAFYESGITEFVMPADTVTDIGARSFYGCDKLESITLSSSLKEIPVNAFANCALKNIILPEGLTSIGDSAFYNCTQLESCTIPNSVTSIGTACFNLCSSLETVKLPTELTVIPQDAFRECTALTNVGFPDSLTEIQSNAFYKCESLTSITISEKVKSIGSYAFSYCTGVTDIYFNAPNLTNATQPFNGAGNEETLVTVHIGDQVEVLSDGIFSGLITLGSVEMGTSVTKIGDGAFSSCSNLKEIEIPNTVTEIGDMAFYYCQSLTSITLPDAITVIGESCFDSCIALEEVQNLKNVTSIEGCAFKFCSALKAIELPECLTFIGREAFQGCTLLKEINLPEAIETIEYYAFDGCTGLTEITVPENVTTLESGAFTNCSNVEVIYYNAINASTDGSIFYSSGTNNDNVTVNIGDKVQVLPMSLFAGMTTLTCVNMGSSVSEIESSCFRNCTALPEIIIPDNVTVIEAETFYDCTSLTSIQMPEGITHVRKYAFYNCSALTELELAKSIILIDDYAFYGCTKMVLAELPDGLEYIGDYAFYQCNGLVNLDFGTSLKKIYPYAFYQCKSLKTISFPETLESIGTYAFRECSALNTVVLNEGLKDIPDYAFYDCTSLSELNIPTTVTHIGISAFGNCPLENDETLENGIILLDNWVIGYTGTVEELIIPDSVVGIIDRAFYRDEVITSVTLPKSLRYIGVEAFWSCSNLTNLTSGNNVEIIGSDAFWATPLYENTECLIIGTYLVKYSGTETEYTVPGNVNIIGEDAFRFASIETLIIPETVTEIEEYAFAYSDLKSIKWEGHEDMTFMEFVKKYGRTATMDIPLVNTITESWYALEGATTGFGTDGTSLTSLVGRLLARQILEEADEADIKAAYDWLCSKCGYSFTAGYHYSYADGPFFNGIASCQGVALAFKAFLDELGYPNFILEGKVTGDDYGTVSHAWNVVKIGTNWLHFDATDTTYGDYSTYAMTSTYARGTLTYQWNNTDFDELVAETLATYENGEYEGESPLTFTLQEDDTYWVTDCAVKETSVEIPAEYNGVAVTGIGSEAFMNCSKLESIVIPEGILTIEANAFKHCISLEEVKLPSTVTRLDGAAFRSCISLVTADFSDSAISTLKDNTFMGCISLKNIILSEKVTTISSDFAQRGAINRVDGTENYIFHGLTGSATEYFAKEYGYDFVSTGIVQHNLTKIDAVAPTCAEEGNIEYYTCSHCELLFADKDAGTVIESADTVLAKLEHTPVTDPAVAATCANTGLTEGEHCSVCGKVIVAQKVIEALDHTEVVDPAVAATCTKTGLTEGNHCSVCNEIIVAQTTVAAKGHTMGSWKVITKSTYTKEGLKTRTCSVCDFSESQVIKVVEATSITLDNTSLNLSPGKAVTLTTTCTPITPSEGDITWSSSNDAVATVDANGKVTAVGDGTAIITATLVGITATCEVTVITEFKPDAPTNLKAVLSGGHDDVKVTWTASENATGYYVYYKKSTASAWSTAKSTTATSYTIKDLEDNVKYDFKVVAYYESGDNVYFDGAKAATASVMTKKNIAAPSTVKAVLYGYDDVKLTWSKSSGASGYIVYYKIGSGAYKKLKTTTSLTYKAANLSDGVLYTFKIVPYYKNGSTVVESYYSKTVGIYTLKKLSAPTVSKASSTKIKVSWQNISGESGYQLSKSTSKTGTSIVATTTGTSKTLTVTRNKGYYYKVRAYKTVSGTKIYGPWSSVTSYNLRYVAAQGTVTAALYGYDDVKLSWKKVTGANYYDVYYKKSSDSSYTKLGTTTGTSYKKANLSDGVKYTFKVVPTYKSSGKIVAQGSAKTASVTTLKQLNTPTVTKSSSTKVKVAWNNIGGETGYQISQSTSKTGTKIVSTYATTSGKSKTITATKGKTYYYKVRAYKTVGSKKIYGPWSSVTAYKLK